MNFYGLCFFSIFFVEFFRQNADNLKEVFDYVERPSFSSLGELLPRWYPIAGIVLNSFVCMVCVILLVIFVFFWKIASQARLYVFILVLVMTG